MAVGADRIKSTFFRIGNNGSSGTTRSSSPESERNYPRTSIPAPLLSFVDTGSSTLNPKEEKLMTTLTQQGYFTSREIIDMLLDPSKRKTYLLKAINRPQKESSDKKNYSSQSVVTGSSGSFVLTGSGWGHGVGLSQWGARNLALNGWDSRKILQHYFPAQGWKNYINSGG